MGPGYHKRKVNFDRQTAEHERRSSASPCLIIHCGGGVEEHGCRSEFAKASPVSLPTTVLMLDWLTPVLPVVERRDSQPLMCPMEGLRRKQTRGARRLRAEL